MNEEMTTSLSDPNAGEAQRTPSTFFVAGGTLSPNVSSYVERPADDELFNRALAGEYCYVLTARQMGKSSLMMRTARRLQETGVQTAIIDLTTMGTTESVDTWYLDILTDVADQLDLSEDVEAWWEARASLGQVRRFVSFLREVVLQEIQDRVVIFVDEIDKTLGLDFRDEFFAAIRATYNARPNHFRFNRLTFVLLGVASPPDLIKDPVLTPFNIGREIDLREFNWEDAQVLQKGLEAVYPEHAAAIFSRIYDWTDGHPYLTQKLCLAVVERGSGEWTDEQVDEVVKRLFLSEEVRGESNLKFVQDKILSHPQPQRRKLLGVYKEVYKGKKVQDEGQSLVQNRLKLAGLVKAEDGRLHVRNEIYRRVFDLAWVRANTAINWWPIVAGVAIFLTVLASGTIAYNARVGIQAQDCIANFYQTNEPEEQVSYLVRLFGLRGLFGPADYDYKARELFYGLSRDSQLAIFAVDDIDDPDLVLLVRSLYITLADVDSTDNTRPLLRAMLDALGDRNGSEETKALRDEITNWLNARTYAKQNRNADAMAAYSEAIKLKSDNPATLYERARVLIALSEYQRALSDLDRVVVIARQVLASTPTPLPSAKPNVAPTPTSTITPTFTRTPLPTAPIPFSPLSPVGTPSPDVAITSTKVHASAVVTSTLVSQLTATPSPTSTATSASIASEFATSGQMMSAVRNLISDNPEMARELVRSSNSYPNLEELGLVPAVSLDRIEILINDVQLNLSELPNMTSGETVTLEVTAFDTLGNRYASEDLTCKWSVTPISGEDQDIYTDLCRTFYTPSREYTEQLVLVQVEGLDQQLELSGSMSMRFVINTAAVVFCPGDEEMVFVEGGLFLMGSSHDDIDLFATYCPPEQDDPNCGPGYFEDELPKRSVRLPSFCIDQNEVTNSQFSQFVEATGYETTAEQRGYSVVWDDKARSWKTDIPGADWRHPSGPGSSISGKESHPVVQMSWYDANAYCEWAVKRLPTNEEWEKAARGTDGRNWPWGNSWESDYLNYYGLKPPGTKPVGSFTAGMSPYGAMDMLGNALEWTATIVQGDPSNPLQVERRGGSWGSVAVYLHVPWRNYAAPDDTGPTVGFRCAKTYGEVR